MNYWENWKLNLQNEGKPFFTVATTVAGVDADNEHVESFPINTWTHLVVSMDLNAHTLSFYVNGELTKLGMPAENRVWQDLRNLLIFLPQEKNCRS